MSLKNKFSKHKMPLLSILFLGVIFTVYFNGLSFTAGTSGAFGVLKTYAERVNDKETITLSDANSLLANLRANGLDDEINSMLSEYSGKQKLDDKYFIDKPKITNKLCPKKVTSVKFGVTKATYNIATTDASDLSFSFGARESVKVDKKTEDLNTINIGVSNRKALVNGNLTMKVVACDVTIVNITLPIKITGLDLKAKAHFSSMMSSFRVKKMVLSSLVLSKFEYNLADFPALSAADYILRGLGVYGASDVVKLANTQIENQLKVKTDQLDGYKKTINDAVLPALSDNLGQEMKYTTSEGSKVDVGITLDQIETFDNGLVVKFSSQIDIEGKENTCSTNLDLASLGPSFYPAKVSGYPSLGIGVGLLQSLAFMFGKEGLFCMSQSGFDMTPNGALSVSSSSYIYIAKEIVYVPIASGRMGNPVQMILSQKVSSGTADSPSVTVPVSFSATISEGVIFHGQADLTINFAIETQGDDKEVKLAIKYMKMSNLTSSDPKPFGIELYIQNLLNQFQEQRITQTISKRCEVSNSNEAWDQTVYYERVKEDIIQNCSVCEKVVGFSLPGLKDYIRPFVNSTTLSSSRYTVSFGNSSPYPKVIETLEKCPEQTLKPDFKEKLDEVIDETNDRLNDNNGIRDEIDPI
jgi:hypothetical protein